jgi:hypothetical protein
MASSNSLFIEVQMKNIILLFSMVGLFISLVFAQDMQYVSRQSGDTLFVKDDIEYTGINTLYSLMRSDSLAPATRVYFLKAGGIYSCANNPSSSSKYRTIIMGPEQNLKTGSPTMPPPIISGIDGGVATPGGMIVNKDLLVKNIDLEIGSSSGNNGGWAYFGFTGSNMRLEVDNCIMEHTWWTWVGGPPANTSIFFTNDYFVNLNGYGCRRDGGVVDFNGTTKHQDTLSVQNCTHVNTQGTLYKFRSGYTVDRAIFNHNDFIGCVGYVLMNCGDQTNLSITNNIFVNCQLQAYCPVLSRADAGEVDLDSLPMGLVNVRVDSTFTANVGTHGIYVDKNLAYWDPSLSDIVTTLNTNHVDGNTHWVSQMIPMNTRTIAIFSDDTHYPKLYNDTWFTQLPTFADTKDLFTTQLGVVKAYAIAAVDTSHDTSFGPQMPSWRQASNPEASNFIHADWPIPIDLSYTDASLLTAGLFGFPVGDLNWFPTQYASWKAQEAHELAHIQKVLNTGNITAVRAMEQLPQTFQLDQNYPNPFNPSTDIRYTIAQAGNVTLKVYNMLGQEAATLVNGFQTANTYNVNFNASGLSGGVYFNELRTGSSVRTKKMILMK